MALLTSTSLCSAGQRGSFDDRDVVATCQLTNSKRQMIEPLRDDGRCPHRVRVVADGDRDMLWIGDDHIRPWNRGRHTLHRQLLLESHASLAVLGIPSASFMSSRTCCLVMRSSRLRRILCHV